MKILLVVNTFGKHIRQTVAVESWISLKSKFSDNLDILNLQFEDDIGTDVDLYEELSTEFSLKTSSRTYCSDSIKKLPVLFEMLERGFEKLEYNYIVYTNSDVILLPKLVEYILSERPDCIAGSRLDIEHIESFNDVLENKVVPVRMEIAGYDFFAFERSWFHEYKSYFDTKFVTGKPHFDVIYAGLMIAFGRKYHIANDFPVMGLHIYHGLDSCTTECPEKDHNRSIADNGLFKILCGVVHYNLQHNLCKRTPWGGFIFPQENESTFQSTYYNTINIHTDNHILKI